MYIYYKPIYFIWIKCFTRNDFSDRGVDIRSTGKTGKPFKNVLKETASLFSYIV